MLDWIKKQSIKTQLKLTLCGLLLVAITFIGNMTYHQVSAILINKGIQSTRTQLSALSTQLQHQYQTYQKKRDDSIRYYAQRIYRVFGPPLPFGC
ncbi:hypothetical protein [Vibrio coralliilyticus]|uniref:hypothetical protein n=1 Tax=Vibrio coralliilyticus TaxID=190893 RepID=UPI00301E39AD